MVPTIPSVPTLAPGNDTGISAADHVTRLTSLVFTGTAEAGVLVTLQDHIGTGGPILGSGPTDGLGGYSVPVTLPGGLHRGRAQATNIAGDSGWRAEERRGGK